MKNRINKIIEELIMIRESLGESAEEIIFVDMGCPVHTEIGKVKDLTFKQVEQLNKLRKDIHTLDEIIHYLSIMED